MSGKQVGKEILGVVDNQLINNDPPETKKTYERLRSLGYDDDASRNLIAQCVAVEIFNIMKHQLPFDEERFVLNLENLPNAPFGEED